MSALLKLQVSPEGDGEPFVVEVTSRDMLIWEKREHGRSYARLTGQQDMAPMYEIAHIGAVRLGLFSGSLAAFESTCDIEPLDQDEAEAAAAAGPTRPARSTTRRSRSR